MSENFKSSIVKVGKFIVDRSALGNKKTTFIKKQNTFSDVTFENIEETKINHSNSYTGEACLLKENLFTLDKINQEPFISDLKDFYKYYNIKNIQ